MTEIPKNLSKTEVCFSCGDPVFNRDHMLPQVIKGFSPVRRKLLNHPLKTTVDNTDNQFGVCKKEHDDWDKIKVGVFLGKLGCGLRLCERFGGENVDCPYERFCVRDPKDIKVGESAYWRYIFESEYDFYNPEVDEEEPDPISVINFDHQKIIQLTSLEEEAEIMQRLDGEPEYLMWYLSEKYPTPIFSRHFEPYVQATRRTLKRYRSAVGQLKDEFSPSFTQKYRRSIKYAIDFEKKVNDLSPPKVIFDMSVINKPKYEFRNASTTLIKTSGNSDLVPNYPTFSLASGQKFV